MVVNATINKISKGEVEQVFNNKCDKRDFDLVIQGIQARIDEEIGSLSEAIGRKANVEDLGYYRKELSYKLDKSELEAFRQDFVDRVTAFDMKLHERNQILQ